VPVAGATRRWARRRPIATRAVEASTAAFETRYRHPRPNHRRAVLTPADLQHSSRPTPWVPTEFRRRPATMPGLTGSRDRCPSSRRRAPRVAAQTGRGRADSCPVAASPPRSQLQALCTAAGGRLSRSGPLWSVTNRGTSPQQPRVLAHDVEAPRRFICAAGASGQSVHFKITPSKTARSTARSYARSSHSERGAVLGRTGRWGASHGRHCGRVAVVGRRTAAVRVPTSLQTPLRATWSPWAPLAERRRSRPGDGPYARRRAPARSASTIHAGRLRCVVSAATRCPADPTRNHSDRQQAACPSVEASTPRRRRPLHVWTRPHAWAVEASTGLVSDFFHRTGRAPVEF